MNKLICITGLTGAGKSMASDYLVSKGCQFVRFGQPVLDEIKKRNLQPIDNNEKPIRDELRKRYGMGAMAILNLPNFKILLKKGNVIGDDLMSLDEFEVLKKEFKDRVKLIALYAPPNLRYRRLKKRKLKKSDTSLRHRPASIKAAKSRDLHELISLKKGAAMAMADYMILNTKTVGYLIKQLDGIYEDITRS